MIYPLDLALRSVDLFLCVDSSLSAGSTTIDKAVRVVVNALERLRLVAEVRGQNVARSFQGSRDDGE